MIKYLTIIGAAIFSIAGTAQQTSTSESEISSKIDRSFEYQASNLDSALFIAEIAHKESILLENDSLVARTSIRLASVYSELTQFEKALQYAMRAYKIGQSTGIVDIQVSASNVLHTVYSASGNKDLAAEYGERSIALAEANGLHVNLIRALINYSHFIFDEKPDSAISILRYAESITVDSQNQDFYTIQLNLASMHAINGDFELAAKRYKYLMRHKTFQENVTSMFYALLNLGYCYIDMGLPDTAFYYIDSSLQLARGHGLQKEMSYALLAKSDVFRQRNQLDSALHYFELFHSQNDSLLNSERVQAISNLREQFEAEQRESQILNLSQQNEMAGLQRNFFIVLAFLFLAVATAAIIIYSNRLRANKILAEQRIANIEKEKEVLSLQSMLFAQEEERQRIARDLHDSIGALLSTAKLHLGNIEAEVKKLNDLNFLKNTEDMIDRASIEVRRVAHNMMPGVLMKLGLIEGLEDFFDRIRKSSAITLSFTYDQLPFRLDNAREVMIYRIVQELANNSLKHANADEIKLMIKVEGDDLVLDYRDDGKGFEPELMGDPYNFGLSGIRSRINFLNGTLNLSTSPGKGVSFRIQIPMKGATAPQQ